MATTIGPVCLASGWWVDMWRVEHCVWCVRCVPGEMKGAFQILLPMNSEVAVEITLKSSVMNSNPRPWIHKSLEFSLKGMKSCTAPGLICEGVHYSPPASHEFTERVRISPAAPSRRCGREFPGDAGARDPADLLAVFACVRDTSVTSWGRFLGRF